MVKPQAGTYALVFSSTKAAPITIGKLGTLDLQPGFCVYVGSAHGPGGLRARLAHHLKPTDRSHWHVDYLWAHASPEEVWYCYGAQLREHRWAKCIGMQPGASIPLARFGASDCQCESHLFFFGSRPSWTAIAGSLRAIDHRHPPVRLHRLKS